MDGVIIDEITVRKLAVFAKSLTMVADYGDDFFFAQIISIEPGKTSPDLLIHECDFTIIETAYAVGSVLRAIRFGRRVGCVRIVKVHPCEKRFRFSSIQPVQCRIYDFITRPLHQTKIEFLVLL